MSPAPGTPSNAARYDIGALLPGVGVFGGVRRFLALGNEFVRRGHRFVLYHPQGNAPGWMPFTGETRPLAALPGAPPHEVLLCGEPSLVPQFEAATARLKLFYCVLEKLPDERALVRHPGWRVLANSSGIRDRLWRRHRVRALPAIGGIDLDHFRPVGPLRPAQPLPFRVLVYGRLSRSRKGTGLVIRAAEGLARTARRDPAWGGGLAQPVQLVLFDHVGPGNETDPRPQLRCAIPAEFHLNEPQAALPALYSSCDVFVSAERRAGWNNTVAEAMACGVPVVCTASGTRDLARHGETAWVARFRHPFFLRQGLVALARDTALRQRLAGAARAGLTPLAWERVADQIEAAIAASLPWVK